MKRLTYALALILTLAAFATPESRAGNALGNGGDHVRAMFLKMGGAVLKHLENTQEGSALVRQHSLDLGQLKSALDAEKILIVEGSLLDWGGSSADATGQPGKITLRKETWIDHFEKGRDVYYLVFHEMLRSASYDDNSYVISKTISPFPVGERVFTKINPLVPLVGEDQIAPHLRLGQIGLGGSGCLAGQAGTSFDFDAERNVLDVSFETYVARAGLDGVRMGRGACSFAIPLQLPPGKRLVVTQMDVLARAKLAPGSKAGIRSEAFLGGSIGAPHQRKIAPASISIDGRILVRRIDVLRSRCGGADNIRFNTSVDLESLPITPSRDAKPNAIAAERISFYFRLESCTR